MSPVQASLPQADSGPHVGLSSALFIVAAVAATLGALTDWHPLTTVASVALALFAVLEFRRVPLAQKVAAGLLLGISVILALWHGDLLRTFVLGIERTLPFLLVFASIGWLRASAGESPSVKALRVALAQMGPGRRFASLEVAAHAMGAGFNLAGMALLAPMLEDTRGDPAEARRLRCAILWGFSSATCWSPFYVGTAAVLAALPGLPWIRTVPYGLGIAAGFLCLAVLYDRLFHRRGERIRIDASPQGLARPVLRLLVAIALLFALTLSLMEGAGLALTTTIAIVGPSFSLGWLWLIHRNNRHRVGRIAHGVLADYAGMRTETLLFICANIFGVAIAGELPQHALAGSAMEGITGLRPLDTLLLVWGYLAFCAIGIHPIVALIVFSSLVEPASLGLPLPVLGAVLMTLWGMGTAVSPLSGTTLFMSQMSRASSFTIAWRWSGPFYLLGSLWIATVVTVLS